MGQAPDKFMYVIASAMEAEARTKAIKEIEKFSRGILTVSDLAESLYDIHEEVSESFLDLGEGA